MSLGLLLTMGIVIPFGWVNLDENMGFQWVSGVGTLVLVRPMPKPASNTSRLQGRASPAVAEPFPFLPLTSCWCSSGTLATRCTCTQSAGPSLSRR